MILNVLPIALLLTGFKENKRQILLKEKVKIKESLVTCFICIVGQNKYMDKAEFQRLMETIYKNNQNRIRIIDQLFMSLDKEENGRISLKQFSKVVKVIRSQQKYRLNRYASNKIWLRFRTKVENRLQLKRLVNSKIFKLFFISIAIISSSIIMYQSFYFKENNYKVLYKS